MATYKVHESNIDKLTAKAQMIEKKCHRYNCEFHFRIDDTPIFEDIKDEDGKVVTHKFFSVEASGVARINGWQFVATLEHKENGNIIRKALNDIEVPNRYRTTKPICEHCGTLRNRKDTYLVRNIETGEFKQVGKSCLKDFTGGLDVEFCAAMAQFEKDMEGSGSVASGWQNPSYIDVKDLLAASVLVIKAFGYVPTNGYGITSRDAALQLHNEHHGMFDVLSKPNREELHSHVTKTCEDEEAQQVAKDAHRWLYTQEDSDYIHNLKVATSSTHCSRRDTGLVVSLIQSYFKAVDREQRKAIARKVNAASQWVGQQGDKIEANIASSKYVTSWETEWGYTYMYQFVTTDGNILIWKTGKDLDLDTPVESIKGTVKNHTEFNGAKQTELTRCKITFKPQPKAEAGEDLLKYFSMIGE